jgi:hypothetical protein
VQRGQPTPFAAIETLQYDHRKVGHCRLTALLIAACISAPSRPLFHDAMHNLVAFQNIFLVSEIGSRMSTVT